MARACARHILVDSEDRCEQLKNEILAGSDFTDVAKETFEMSIRRARGRFG